MENLLLTEGSQHQEDATVSYISVHYTEKQTSRKVWLGTSTGKDKIADRNSRRQLSQQPTAGCNYVQNTPPVVTLFRSLLKPVIETGYTLRCKETCKILNELKS